MNQDYIARVESLAPSLGLGAIKGRQAVDDLIRRLSEEQRTGSERAGLLLERLDIGGIRSRFWSVGVTTTRREPNTLERCLASIESAGWDEVALFVDGDVSVPDGYTTTRREPSVGAFANWFLALQELVQRDVKASAYLLVQDDAVFCRNAREYLDAMPYFDGITSLYRSEFYSGDTTFEHNGATLFVGAVALMFSQSAARRLVSSEFGVRHRLRNVRANDFIDGSLGEWCQETKTKLRVLGPSLCQHVGDVSTLGHDEKPSTCFVGEDYDATRLFTERPLRKRARIGLVGYNVASGLGYLHRDMATGLDVDKWLVIEHSRFNQLDDIAGISTRTVPETIGEQVLRDWLEGLDAIVFAETSLPPKLPAIARSRGVKTVCVPMVEWLPDDDWTKDVDLWLAPTLHSANVLLARGFDGRIVCQPWPIDTTRIEYRQRTKANRFVFAHGNGGPRDRKGGLLVAEAARLAKLPLTVFSQTATHRSSMTQVVEWERERVDFRGSCDTPNELYLDGDVFLAPSRWEGLGLQLLECLAAGMPLITTNGGPMNEVPALRLLEATPNVIELSHPMFSFDVAPEELVAAIQEVRGRDIREASRDAHEWVTRQRCWSVLGPRIRRLITD